MFLRKIYNELVLIRKELQTLRPKPRFKKYREVQVFEKRYINQSPHNGARLIGNCME